MTIIYYDFKLTYYYHIMIKYFSEETKYLISISLKNVRKQKYNLLEMIAAGVYKSSIKEKIPSAAME